MVAICSLKHITKFVSRKNWCKYLMKNVNLSHDRETNISARQFNKNTIWFSNAYDILLFGDKVIFYCQYGTIFLRLRQQVYWVMIISRYCTQISAVIKPCKLSSNINIRKDISDVYLLTSLLFLSLITQRSLLRVILSGQTKYLLQTYYRSTNPISFLYKYLKQT